MNRPTTPVLSSFPVPLAGTICTRFSKQPANGRKFRNLVISSWGLDTARTSELIHCRCPTQNDQMVAAVQRSWDSSNEKMPATGETCAGGMWLLRQSPDHRGKCMFLAQPRQARTRGRAPLGAMIIAADCPACNVEHDHLHEI
jgi:hypothetical protein